MKQTIYVAGYPKSGNTWLSRLLGEIYEAPVARWRTALPLACEGEARESDTVIHQLHLKPIHENEPIQEQAVNHAYKWDWRVPLKPQERIVFIIRDVRDIIVSAWHYWQRETIADAADAVLNGNHPLSVHGPWKSFNKSWFDVLTQRRTSVIPVKYELLVEQTALILDLLTFAQFGQAKIEAAVERQSFEATRKRIEQDGDERPYGKEVQLRNLRKGVSGDWRNHFDEATALLVEENCGDFLREIGYDAPLGWWKNV